MFNCCPLSQTGSPFSLRRRERQAKYNHWFYQKVHSRKKITKITKYQWKPTRVHQQVKRARSRMTARPGCAGGAQQPTYLEALHWSAAGWCTGRAGHWWSWAGQGVTLLSHAESSHWAPAGPSALSALQQKMPPVRHPGATARLAHSCPHCTSVSSFTSPSSRKSFCWKNGISAEIFGFHNNTKEMLRLL